MPGGNGKDPKDHRVTWQFPKLDTWHEAWNNMIHFIKNILTCDLTIYKTSDCFDMVGDINVEPTCKLAFYKIDI